MRHNPLRLRHPQRPDGRSNARSSGRLNGQRRHDMPFGAALGDDGSVRFRLWAPAAARVDLLLRHGPGKPDANGNVQVLAMAPVDSGWFEITTNEAGAGSRYRYRIGGEGGTAVPDPASRYNPGDVHGDSEVIDPRAFAWKDGDWAGRPWHEAVIYELHVGTFDEVTERPAERAEVVLEGLSDDALMKISKDGTLSLTLDEMRTIQGHFRALGRHPTDVELETLAQTWSEHCVHKTLKGLVEYTGPVGADGPVQTMVIDNLLKQTIARATFDLAMPWCLSVFKDNSGVIEYDDDTGVCIKVETHNRPSAIEPYGGANTGLGGVVRDVIGTGLGAKPIFNTCLLYTSPSPRD